jgi:hypothetical protein
MYIHMSLFVIYINTSPETQWFINKRENVNTQSTVNVYLNKSFIYVYIQISIYIYTYFHLQDK